MSLEQQQDSDNQAREQPWYRNPSTNLPFRLYLKLELEGSEQDALRTAAFFPWDDNSLRTLWSGSLATEENLTKWTTVLDKFRDVIAIGGDTSVYVLWLKRRKHPLQIKIPETPEVNLIHSDTTNVAWALSPNAIEEPLLILSRGSLLWIYNPIRKGLSSYLRGHGGAITSLAVHPTVPNLFCSTSRDHSTRIYDLTLTPHRGHKDRDVNPHWPPGTLPSRAGAPHGLHMNEAEGTGIARCIVVLMGGRSGGHEAAVLNASFHPQYPIIATCGIDRCIKLWHVNPRNSAQITREDKPLFSSSRIHRSRVLSVQWISYDTLISHNPSAILRDEPNDIENKKTHLVPGEIVVWRWLGLDRFFPPLYDNLRAEGQTQSVLRGCASDYQESASFTVLANASFPDLRLQLISPNVNIYQSPVHDPVALCTLPAGLPYIRTKKEEKKQNQSNSTTGGQKGNDNHSAITGKTPRKHVSHLPPDEKPITTKVSTDGRTKTLAGTVELVHVPSLPIRLPSRFPLDKPANASLGPPAEAIESDLPALSGISEWNAELIEREPPPPISGWTLDVPLSENDLIFESPSPSTSAGGDGEAGHAMQIDHSMRIERSNAKGKEREQRPSSRDVEEPPIRVRVQNAVMGMNGKVVVVLGTRGRVWVYRIKTGGQIGSTSDE